MKDDETTRSGLSRLSAEIDKNIMYLLLKDGRKIEIPYLGLRCLDQVHFIDVARKVREFFSDANFWGWRGVGIETMGEVWRIIVEEIYWFEHSCRRVKKLTEVSASPSLVLIRPLTPLVTFQKDSDEARNYWKLLEYGAFVQSGKPTDHKVTNSNDKVPSVDKGHTPSVVATPQTQIDLPIKQAAQIAKLPSIATRAPVTRKELGYFPSIAAHIAQQPPNVVRDNSELSRLRKLVGEYEVLNQDLSTRLIKAKKVEEQHLKELARYAERFRQSNNPEECNQEEVTKHHARFDSSNQSMMSSSHVKQINQANLTHQTTNPPDQMICIPERKIDPSNEEISCFCGCLYPRYETTTRLDPGASLVPQKIYEQDIQRLYQQQVPDYCHPNETLGSNMPEVKQPDLPVGGHVAFESSTQMLLPASNCLNTATVNPNYQATNASYPSGAPMPQQLQLQQHNQVLNEQHICQGYANDKQPSNISEAVESHMSATNQVRLVPSTQSAISAMDTQNPRFANPNYQTTYTYSPGGRLVSQQQESSHQQYIQILNQQNNYYGQERQIQVPSHLQDSYYWNANEARIRDIPASGNGRLGPTTHPATPTSRPPDMDQMQMVRAFEKSRNEYLMRQDQARGYGFAKQSLQSGWENGPRWL